MTTSNWEERFDKIIGDVPEHAKYIIDKYTKDGCCYMCGHPAQGNTVIKEIKLFITQRLSDRNKEIVSMIEEMKKKRYIPTWNYESSSDERSARKESRVKGYNQALSDVISKI